MRVFRFYKCMSLSIWQAVEIIFSCKSNKPVHPELSFNNVPLSREDSTKHLGVYLDTRLNFSKHVKEKIKKAMKGIALLKFLSKYVNGLSVFIFLITTREPSQYPCVMFSLKNWKMDANHTPKRSIFILPHVLFSLHFMKKSAILC